MKYSPSLACANPLNFDEDLKQIQQIKLNTIHYDIMDGCYVPNFCLNFDLIDALSQNYPEMVCDVHLMVEEPEKHLHRLTTSNISLILFHIDSTRFSYRLLQTIRKMGKKAGVVVNPSQTIQLLAPVLHELDAVLLMSIEPGFAGQKFMPNTMERLDELVGYRNTLQLDFEIIVDGGITAEIGRVLRNKGADTLILGYPAIFGKSEGIVRSFEKFKESVEKNDEPNIYKPEKI